MNLACVHGANPATGACVLLHVGDFGVYRRVDKLMGTSEQSGKCGCADPADTLADSRCKDVGTGAGWDMCCGEVLVYVRVRCGPTDEVATKRGACLHLMGWDKFGGPVVAR